jgi:prolyl-tRNA editing enzyme YbaK/EbsC (Cys-tRNA(Pro) deacylase)
MREKVIDSARALGLEMQVKRLDESTATVADAAAALDCIPARIAKSLVFVADGDPVVCIASGEHRVDVNRLADVLDVASVRAASPSEVRAATGFRVGGVPPFGHGLPVVLDEALLAHDRVWAACGDDRSLFEADPRALARCTEAIVAPVGV